MYYSVFGDSISTFYDKIPDGYALFYTKEACLYCGIEGVEDIWWHQVITALGGTPLNDNAYSGSRVSGKGFPAGCSMERVTALGDGGTPDRILVYLGHNDYGHNVPVGSPDEAADETVFYDAYVLMLKRLQATYPNAEIFCATLMATYSRTRPDWSFPKTNAAGYRFCDYNDAIRKACAACGVRCVDIDKTGILCDSCDGAHGTKRGHKEIADAWMQCLSDLL